MYQECLNCRLELKSLPLEVFVHLPNYSFYSESRNNDDEMENLCLFLFYLEGYANRLLRRNRLQP